MEKKIVYLMYQQKILPLTIKQEMILKSKWEKHI